jgi:hypothetical protein
MRKCYTATRSLRTVFLTIRLDCRTDCFKLYAVYGSFVRVYAWTGRPENEKIQFTICSVLEALKNFEILKQTVKETFEMPR